MHRCKEKMPRATGRITDGQCEDVVLRLEAESVTFRLPRLFFSVLMSTSDKRVNKVRHKQLHQRLRRVEAPR